MRWNARNAVRGPLCVLMTAGAMLAALSGLRAGAQSADQKPAESYQTIYLKYMTEPHEMNDVVSDLRNMLPKARIFRVESANAISIQGSADEIATAQRILGDLDQPRKTYRLTYTIGDKEGGQRFVMIATSGNKAILKQGSRVPIVTGKNGAGSDESTQVQYLDVGVMIEASLSGAGDGMRLRTKIEQTSVADEKSNVGIQDPVIHQSVLEGDSAVTTGKPVAIGSVDIPGSGGHMEVQVMAEVVK